MFGLSPAHLVIILVILLIIVGPGKLPETGAAIGKALRGFKDAVETGEVQAAAPSQPQAPQPVQQAPVQLVQPMPQPMPAPIAPIQSIPVRTDGQPPASPQDPTLSI